MYGCVGQPQINEYDDDDDENRREYLYYKSSYLMLINVGNRKTSSVLSLDSRPFSDPVIN